MNNQKILVKFPTKSRAVQFLKTLEGWINKASDNSNIHYLISIDIDDKTMTNDVVEKAKSLAPNITVIKGLSANKIQACNRDIEEVKNWDIVILISDDMFCEAKGWDDIIRRDMAAKYPDTDGALWYYDGYQDRICTMSILGHKYYERLGYIYHPSYSSLFCDNEHTIVAGKLVGMKMKAVVIAKHQHPLWGGKCAMDELYKYNEGLHSIDKANYEKRLAINFGLTD